MIFRHIGAMTQFFRNPLNKQERDYKAITKELLSTVRSSFQSVPIRLST